MSQPSHCTSVRVLEAHDRRSVLSHLTLHGHRLPAVCAFALSRDTVRCNDYRLDGDGLDRRTRSRDRRDLDATTTTDVAIASVDDGTLPADRFLDRELSWLAFNQRVLELAEDPSAPAARARQLPGDLRDQPRRILHGARRRTQAPHRDRPRRSDQRRPSRRSSVLDDISAKRARAAGAARARLPRPRQARARRRGHPHRGAGPTSTRPTASASTRSSRPRSSRCSCRSRSTPRIRSPTSRGSRSTSRCACATRRPTRSSSRASRCRRCCRASCSCRTTAQPAAVHPARRPHLQPPRRAFPGHGDRSSTTSSASRATRTSRSRRTRPRTSSRRSRRSCCAAASARPSGSRSPTTWTTVTLGLLVRELGITEQEVYRLPAPLDLGGLFQLTGSTARAAVPAARARDRAAFLPAEPTRTSRHLRVDRARRHAAASPLRVVRDERAGVPRAGRRRPERARHQADALPHER